MLSNFHESSSIDDGSKNSLHSGSDVVAVVINVEETSNHELLDQCSTCSSNSYLL